MADYDDIEWSNQSLPYFPKEMNIFQKVLCLFGNHKWEKRESKYIGTGFLREKRKYPLTLREQCVRCKTLK